MVRRNGDDTPSCIFDAAALAGESVSKAIQNGARKDSAGLHKTSPSPVIEDRGTGQTRAVSIASLAVLMPLGRLLSARRAHTGRPAKHRAALAIAIAAKAVVNLPTTRDLIGRLRAAPSLRQKRPTQSNWGVTHESRSWRAFSKSPSTQSPGQIYLSFD